jgi:hypothetical protein
MSSEFNIDNHEIDGLSYSCRACDKIRRNNIPHDRKVKLKKSKQQYQKTLKGKEVSSKAQKKISTNFQG